MAAAWALGGNTGTARLALSCWGSLSIVLTLAALRTRNQGVSLTGLWPLLAFDALVLVSLFNPSFREIHRGAESMYLPDPTLPALGFLPSTARPLVSLQSLWFFNAAYLSAFNVLLNVHRREVLRRILWAIVGNAIALAVFGTFQQLSGAEAPYFGAFKSVQPHFFATFIYHNHWAAFTTLMLTAAVGLCFHYAQRGHRKFLNSPGSLALIGVGLLALTMPLSTSRSGTLLALVILLVAVIHWTIYSLRRARAHQTSAAWPLLAVILGLGATAAFAFDLARPVIRVRLAATHTQIAQMRARGEYFPRQVLYEDTWNLARDRLWFGWGMGAYPTAFYLRNTQRVAADGLPRLFHDAHSDWLQSLADVGVIGTTLLALAALVPWWQLRRQLKWTALPLYLVFGCGLVLAYALLEFPFGNRCVIITFWGVLFAAIQYAHLEHERQLTA